MRVIIPLFISICWLYFLHTQWQIGDNLLPPLGSFLSPSTGFWSNVLHPDAPVKRTFEKMGVDGQVYFDERMVPHIFAGNIKDAYYIQGYVHAMHRLWQMDFTTRAAEGRISELIGSKGIDFDKNRRRRGLKESALVSVEHWKQFPDSYQNILAYSDGYNAYLNTLTNADLPIEFKLLNYKPEPWSPYRSSLFHKSMAEILCGRDNDIELTNAKNYFGADFDVIFYEMDSLTDPVIPKGTIWSLKKTQPVDTVVNSLNGYSDWVREKESRDLGSNNWAVNASKSATGYPILCNDPHLQLMLPSVWYEQQIVAGDMNVYGVTFPGIPGVVIGFNKKICWGVTNAAWDVLDWYHIKWKDASKAQYELDGNLVDTKKRIEIIKVKNQKEVRDTVLITYWGPVVFNDPNHRKYDLAMHWIISDPNDQFEFGTFKDLNLSQNFNDYRAAIKQFPYPAQNFAFASVNGDIALTVQGNMPVKSPQQGRFIMDGSHSQNAWHGFIKSEDNPFCYNPERGFISSANQRSTDLSFPNYYNNGDFRDYRGTLINRALAAKARWSVDDMKALQYNSFSLKAETALPYMLQQIDSASLKESAQKVYHQLQSWNYSYDSNRIEPIYFDLWFDYLHEMTWDEILKDSTKKAVAVPTDQTTIAFMKQQANSIWFDYKATSQTEHATEIIRMSFDSLLNYVQLNLRAKDWAEYKDASITHLARIPAFSRLHVRASGSKDIINAHGRTEGPSWRMIVELNPEKINAFGIYPGGQSGNPGSPYYMQMIDEWSRGNYYNLHYLQTPPGKTESYSLMQFNKSK